MKFFINTADLTEIKSLASSGLRDGVTTNPSLVAKSGGKFLEVIAQICEIRVDDIGWDGMQLISDIVDIYNNYDFRTEVLVASVRTPGHVIEAAKMGAHVHPVAIGAAVAVRSPVDGQGFGDVPGGLGEDGSDDRLIRQAIRTTMLGVAWLGSLPARTARFRP
jgi:Transaldolase/Fructose-6-phosphate aldolase